MRCLSYTAKFLNIAFGVVNHAVNQEGHFTTTRRFRSIPFQKPAFAIRCTRPINERRKFLNFGDKTLITDYPMRTLTTIILPMRGQWSRSIVKIVTKCEIYAIL
jgi:hypothetical protein